MVYKKNKFDKVLFIGTFAHGEYYDYLFKNGLYEQQAANSVEAFYLDGLKGTSNSVEILSGLVTKTYGTSKVLSIKENLSEYNGSPITNVGFLNLPYFNIFSQNKKMRKWAKLWVEKNKDSKVLIVVYSLRVPFLKTAAYIKKRISGATVVCIVPDLPQYMHSGGGVKTRITSCINKQWLNSEKRAVDGYVLYAEKMAEDLKLKENTWTVIEGIFDNKTIAQDAKRKTTNSDEITVVYAGGISKDYGVETLVNGFIKAEILNAELHIYGALSGMAEEIKKISRTHKNVQYKGNVNRNALRPILENADLLVNPRPSNGVFTKYSCPSKTLEYMSTATPVLMTRLEGVPSEYYNYVYTIEDESADGIADALVEVIGKKTEERKALGKKAQEFIFNEKNIEKQIEKLYKLVEKL